LGRLFEVFYSKFFEVNPSGRRLFESQGLKIQGRALVSMIGIIVKCLDDFQAFHEVIFQLGGRHEIYGVSAGDYESFATTLSDSVASLNEGEPNHPQVAGVWYKTMMSLGTMMSLAQACTASEGWSTVVKRRLKDNEPFKTTAVTFRLTHKDIYSGEKPLKLRCSVPCNTVSGIDILTPEQAEGLPFPNAISVYHLNEQTATFCFPEKEQMLRFHTELSWRVSAVLRSAKYEDDSTSTDLSQTDGKKSKRPKKFRSLRQVHSQTILK